MSNKSTSKSASQTNYKEANIISTKTIVYETTGKTVQQGRSVVTSKISGSIIMRITPKQPKNGNSKSTGQ